jgi:phage terminase small subunit
MTKENKPSMSRLQNKNAEKIYNRIKKHCEQLGIDLSNEIKNSEAIIVSNAIDTWERNARFCTENGEITPKGKIRPEYYVMHKALNVMMRLERKFGMSPASRARLKKKVKPLKVYRNKKRLANPGGILQNEEPQL